MKRLLQRCLEREIEDLEGYTAASSYNLNIGDKGYQNESHSGYTADDRRKSTMDSLTAMSANQSALQGREETILSVIIEKLLSCPLLLRGNDPKEMKKVMDEMLVAVPYFLGLYERYNKKKSSSVFSNWTCYMLMSSLVPHVQEVSNPIEDLDPGYHAYRPNESQSQTQTSNNESERYIYIYIYIYI